MSCDLRPTEIPGPHYQGDVMDIIDDGWDLMIAHPPCTHLAVSGARWFKYKEKEQEEAVEFFIALAEADIPQICIENPVSIMSSRWCKPTQIIQPWMFGDPYTKTTCLWLENLPPLVSTNIVDKGEFVIHGGKRISKWYSNRTFARDKTFEGVARAMASQWG